MPALVAPPTPAAPAKPAAAAPPSPAPPPAKPTAPAPSKAPETPAPSSDPFDELDARYEAEFKKEPEPEASKKDEAKPKEGEKVKDEKPPEKSTEKPPEKPVVAKDEFKDKTPKQLRERLEQLQAERDDNANKRAAAEAKIAELEKRGLDSTAATEKLAALEKTNEELKGQLRIAKFEASDDFKKQYQAPFNEAAADAKNEVEQLQIVEQDDGNGNITPARQATWKDFAEIYAMDRVTARAVIKRAFGDDATLVMEHYDALKRLDRRQSAALEKEKTEWSEHAKTEQANREKQHQFIAATYTKVSADIADKHAEFMKADDTKPEESKLLLEGLQLVDAKPQTIENKIIHDAQVRLRAGAYPRMRFIIDRQKTEIASLKKEIGELRDSDPRNHDPSRSSGEAGGGEKSERDELAEILES